MNNQFDYYIGLINNRLEQIVTNFSISKDLQESILYSIKAGGKRLRPLIVLLMLADTNNDINIGLDSACAIEMIHTYSLIHDDLPAMDNDDYRRGVKTNHLVFGEGMAILAGDALLTEAFNVIASDNYLNDSQKVHIISILASRAGANGMVGGQALDIMSTGQKLSFEKLNLMHLKKTKELIEASVLIGGLLSNIYPSKQELLLKHAYNLGLSFQIQDDIQDYLESTDNSLANTSSDIKNQKSTYVSNFGMTKTLEIYFNLREETLKIAKELFDQKLLYSLIARVLHDRF